MDKSSPHTSKVEMGLIKSWHSQSRWLWLLLPLSWLYGLVTCVRRIGYQSGLFKSYHAPIPVLVVGNITVGGSGKTPLIIELVTYLNSQNINVGVISRGYGGNPALMPQLVTADSVPSDVGDEPCLIARETTAPVSVCPNRQQAIECLLKSYPETQLIIADDGLQHYRLQRDLEWIVVDSVRGFGNRQLLPTGFLREPISRLNGATVIYHQAPSSQVSSNQVSSNQVPSKTGVSAKPSHFQSSQKNDQHISDGNKIMSMTLIPDQLVPLFNHNKNDDVASGNINTSGNVNKETTLSPQTVYGMSGIGNPQRFFNTLNTLGYNVIEMPMPDHHQFTVNDFIALTDYPIVITAKDAVKVAPLVAAHPKLHSLSIWVLPVRAILSENCYATLLTQLDKVGITSL